jgi:hypothetical protein
VLSSSEILDYTHARRRMERRSMSSGVYWRTRKTLELVAARAGRASTNGRPWLWRLRDMDAT